MQFVITQDGSPTIYDPAFGEHHHSLIGAYTEARYKFAEVARSLIEKRSQIRLLDLPFGLGYNLIATLDLELPAFINCMAIEQSPEVISQIAHCNFPLDLLAKFSVLTPLSQGITGIDHERFRLDLRLDDLRVVLPTLTPGDYDLIYYDAFSPRSAPDLWSYSQVLAPLAKLLRPDGLLVSYTASPKVRKGLMEAGLFIAPGPAVGRKCPGTVAAKYDLRGQFESVTWQKILKATPYP